MSENQHIKSLILHIYADYDKRPGAYKVQFSQDAPNLVWTSDFTYIEAGGKWYYLHRGIL